MWKQRRHVCQCSYIQIHDRSKDLIKSGGEWIGSVEVENIIMGHPYVSCLYKPDYCYPAWYHPIHSSRLVGVVVGSRGGRDWGHLHQVDGASTGVRTVAWFTRMYVTDVRVVGALFFTKARSSRTLS
jgi:acyl-CoA synthetase (AMP-forming)/AMP-acid ligase II